MSLAAKIVLAILLVVAGFAGGIKYHKGVDAQRELEAQQLRESDQRQQRQFNDREALQHAGQVDALNRKLGKAYAQIARLSGRTCLDPGTVGVLNDTGVPDAGRAVAGEPARAAASAASAAGDRAASDRDVAGYIATCRTEYGKLADQLNKILDIEDRRHPLDAP